MRDIDTIIVGAGMAGLACARRLHDAHRPFLVIAEDIGGRVVRSRDGAVNLGAYYVRADYTNVNRFVDLGRRVDRLAIIRHDDTGSYTYWDSRLGFHLPQAARFLKLLIRFRRHYDVFKRRVSFVGQAAALRSDSWLLRLYQRPAHDLVRELRLDDLARWYVAPGLHGTAFASLGDITAFTLLLGALPLLMPAYEFTLHRERLVAGFRDRILTDTVTALGQSETGHFVRTVRSGTWRAEHLVVATPTATAARLLNLPATRQPVSAHMFQVDGVLRAGFSRGDIHLFADADPTLAIARQANGVILLGSIDRDPDFSRFFASWRVVEHHHWNPAFHVVGSELLECEQGSNLFLVGDHNIVGLEDTYLTGLYAANRIIARNGSLRLRQPEELSMPGRRFADMTNSEAALS